MFDDDDDDGMRPATDRTLVVLAMGQSAQTACFSTEQSE